MSNPSKRKGSQFESDVVAYLAEHGFPAAERRVTRGAKDAGDIAGVPGWCLELKATKHIDLASAVDEARAEAANARVENFAAIIKRPRKPISEAYVVVPLSSWVQTFVPMPLESHQTPAPAPKATKSPSGRSSASRPS